MKTILRIALPTPLRKTFDYLAPSDCISPESLQPGIRVRVPFQNRQMIGIITEIVSSSVINPEKLKQVIDIIDKFPIIARDIFELCVWASDYYHHPIGEVFEAALPVLLRQGKPAEVEGEACWFVTQLGLSAGEMKRAPKQKALLDLIIRFPDGVPTSQLKEMGVRVGDLKGLLEKGLVEKLLTNPPQSPPALKHCGAGFFKGGSPIKEDIENPSLCKREVGRDFFSHHLNSEQQLAINAILSNSESFNVFLLDGVTGSGKTEVYLQVIAKILELQKQVLVLVPEIGLTPQTIQRFRERFSVNIVALHSGLNDKERLQAWVNAKNGNAKIIIGTRSSVFTPFLNLGLIVVDEEHDLSFKQQDGFRYNARDLAIMIAKNKNIPIVLGSATPSLESLARASQNKYQHLQLLERAGEAIQPTFQIIDIKNKYLEEGISDTLLETMKLHLQHNEQVMLFLNRRGYAPVLLCHACGWMAKCKRCDARMTFHQAQHRVQCHHCDTRRPVPMKCDACGVKDLQIIGLGTERIEETLKKYFPNYSIARIDRDTTQRKGSMENLLNEIQRGDHQILIGTQMLAKGHHFPNVTLVGIIDADSGFFSSDFRAIEKIAQLILQVSGRAGRTNKQGKVLIQTHHPDHVLLQELIAKSYLHFAKSLMLEREHADLPPYGYLALFRAEAHNSVDAENFLLQIKNISDIASEPIPFWGPVPAPMSKRAGKYRFQLLLHTKQRTVLQKYLRKLLPAIEKLPTKKQVRWSLDVDPMEMF